MAELAPVTLEGWYALHQVFASSAPDDAIGAAAMLAQETLPDGGWSASFQLIGGVADVMTVHFRASLDALAQAQRDAQRRAAAAQLRLVYDFTSVTEAALYHATLEAAQAGAPDSPAYRARLAELVAAEQAGPRMAQRLYPQQPADMNYVCFYPMSKRRTHPDNWYMLSLEERSRIMTEHGLTGRRYAGRIVQVITGAVGFDNWEWGVTLFARDPLEFKRVVSDMRYDEASARYAEFGPCYVGVRLPSTA
jgi:chlorite dismutase